jgi:hypothetical protein
MTGQVHHDPSASGTFLPSVSSSSFILSNVVSLPTAISVCKKIVWRRLEMIQTYQTSGAFVSNSFQWTT